MSCCCSRCCCDAWIVFFIWREMAPKLGRFGVPDMIWSFSLYGITRYHLLVVRIDIVIYDLVWNLYIEIPFLLFWKYHETWRFSTFFLELKISWIVIFSHSKKLFFSVRQERPLQTQYIVVAAILCFGQPIDGWLGYTRYTIFKGWVPAGTHDPDREIYLYFSISKCQFVATFFKRSINEWFDLSTITIRSMPSGAGKEQCRVSVLSFCICLTRLIIDQLLWRFIVTSFRAFSAIPEAEISEPSIMGQEIIDTFGRSCWRGQKSAHFWEAFYISQNWDHLDFVYYM